MIKKEHLSYPILLAEEINGQLHVYCPYCASTHYHGNEGIKIAHCRRVESPFNFTGYYVLKKEKYKEVRRLTNEYPKLRIGVLESGE
ncbi:hypothetical protein HCA15_03705 [Listeria booriae]|uniref:hypothetical protein n=1 Tax=Listeria booriae TaxID=1552123 RepID=UPI00164D4769|nr:hypothetical protein [Listeria booriae]MBC6165742.1 hypothetical protein [Listeria booriae]